MGVDWTKPIQGHSGSPARLIGSRLNDDLVVEIGDDPNDMELLIVSAEGNCPEYGLAGVRLIINVPVDPVQALLDAVDEVYEAHCLCANDSGKSQTYLSRVTLYAKAQAVRDARAKEKQSC
jgi:hypothetical protein